MMQQEQEGSTPLHSVRECCRRLRQEWEGMMQSADIISSEMLSSLKAQEAALAAERKQVQSLKQETCNLRRSCLHTTEEQEKRSLAERKLADQIKENIISQLGEVKQLQCHLAFQLANLRGSIEKIKASKKQESADSLLLGQSISELCNSVRKQPLKDCPLRDEDDGMRSFLSNLSSPESLVPDVECKLSDRLILDTDCKLFGLNDNESAMASRKVSKQNYSKPKSEVLSDKGYAHGQDPSECRIESAGSLLLAYGHQVDQASVKRELDEETDGSQALKKLSYNAGCSVSSLEGVTDELDNVLLSERLEILLQQIYQGLSTNEDGRISEANFLKREKFLGSDRNIPAKRKWEVPIEVALQEDAPGLLEKLQERGLLEDMTIYSAVCGDNYGNENDDFKDLECIARKIWGTASGLIKAPQVIRQHASGLSKDPTYCLSCLVSLIDQAKSLRQRNWPVEWGWCRELQAFIFVFDKHNRVVLERPEYGNATYFFELVQVLPVKWQVLRLIHVLTVTALGKTALLENKPLEVGFELTEEESKILESFGWAPGTGLGSFLNFCDRVFHDVKEDDNLEWRQKIGKCLMDGYDKGRIITPALPLKLLKDVDSTKFEADVKPNMVLLT